MLPDLQSALHSNRVLLMDGAMGTELWRAGVPEGESLAACNLTQPEKVQAIHAAYSRAGSKVLLTNTFQAQGAAPIGHHQEQSLASIILQGISLARKAIGTGGWVLADIGPLKQACQVEVDQMLGACLEADGVLLETFSDPLAAAALARFAQTRPGPKKPVLVSFTFDGNTLRTFDDATPEKCAQAAEELGAAALGVNCGQNLDVTACAEILKCYRAVTRLPLFARPNAGSPGQPHRSPEHMAAALPRLLEAGAVMVGGCCGTTPRTFTCFGK